MIGTELETARLLVRIAGEHDAEGLIAYERRNAEHLRAWETPRETNVEVRWTLLAERRADIEAGLIYPFVARLRHGNDDAIVAVVTLSNVVRYVF